MFDKWLSSVNAEAVQLSSPEAIDQIRSVLPQIIEAVENSEESKGKIVFSKLNSKYGYWRMVIEQGAKCNFCYVLPNNPGKPVELMVPTELQMG